MHFCNHGALYFLNSENYAYSQPDTFDLILLFQQCRQSDTGYQSVVTVLGAIGSAADEAPAHGCCRCLETNDVSANART